MTTPSHATPEPLTTARRRFLARFGIGSAAIGALLGVRLPAGAQPTTAPKRHETDDWMDATANPADADGETRDMLSGLGAHFGVCAMGTLRFAGRAAKSTGGTTGALVEEPGKSLLRNAHLTPAGIVGVGRAQERGYVFGYAG